MQTTTTISLPENLAKEMDKKINEGQFSSRSEFIRSAVRTFLQFEKGQLSWEVLATPFRMYAKEKGLKESDLLTVVEKGRRGKSSKNRN